MTRGATEALQAIIGGYNKLAPGDAVAYADLDYNSMQYAMNWLRDRRGVEVIRTAISWVGTGQSVFLYYERLLIDNPKIKLLLLTHVSHRTGLVPPIAQISEMAAARGVDTVGIDAAHSWGQLDFNVADLKSPFIGFNLQKADRCPGLGVGFLYIPKDTFAQPTSTGISRMRTTESMTSARGFIPAPPIPQTCWPYPQRWTSTVLWAPPTSRPAGGYSETAGYTRSLTCPTWQILTPEYLPSKNPCSTSFRIDGNTTSAQSTAITKYLSDKWGVFTVRRGGEERGEAVRVTPASHNTMAD